MSCGRELAGGRLCPRGHEYNSGLLAGVTSHQVHAPLTRGARVPRDKPSVEERLEEGHLPNMVRSATDVPRACVRASACTRARACACCVRVTHLERNDERREGRATSSTRSW